MSTDLNDTTPISVQILDKDYRIACQRGEQDGLYASARYLDQRMREVRQAGKVIGADRIAVVVALNITHELLQIRKSQSFSEEIVSRRIRNLQRKIEQILDQGDNP